MERKIKSLSFVVTVVILLATISTSVGQVGGKQDGTGEVNGLPSLADPDKFTVELFADLAGHDRNPGDKLPGNWVFHLTLTEGENGFPAGLYVTGGPSFADDNIERRLFRIDNSGQVTIVENGFTTGVETLVFARGDYGDGMLLTQPQANKITRLTSGGNLSTFATVGSGSFGPTTLAYDASGQLYVTDYTAGTLNRLDPDGTLELVAEVPNNVLASVHSSGMKPCIADTSARYGGGLIVGTFTVSFTETSLHGLDSLYSISKNGITVEKFATGFSGIEFLQFGPGDAFGDDLYVATHGTNQNGDGGVFTVTPDGVSTPFLTGIDATHVVFDTKGLFGGGMFIGDMYNYGDAPESPSSKIWRVVPIEDSMSNDKPIYVQYGWIIGIVVLILLGAVAIVVRRVGKSKNE